MALLWTSTPVQYLEQKWRGARLISDETMGQLSVLLVAVWLCSYGWSTTLTSLWCSMLWYEFLYLMLQHWYIFSVRSSEIYSTGEVSFHAEGASDQYFLGTQYLLPRWPTLSISTSILFNSCVVSYIKYDCWKRGGFICSSDFEMRVYLLRGKFETVEVLFATRKLSRSFSLSVQCGQITALLRNYTASKSDNQYKQM